MKVSVFISFMSKARVILSIVTACSSLIVVPIPLVISSMNRALVILSSVCSSSNVVHISLVVVAYLVERF